MGITSKTIATEGWSSEVPKYSEIYRIVNPITVFIASLNKKIQKKQ